MAAKDTRVALIRGINVGKAKRVAMAELRAELEKIGYEDVRTLLNSGNVVFTLPVKSKGEPDARKPQYIVTVRGVGYRFQLPESTAGQNGTHGANGA